MNVEVTGPRERLVRDVELLDEDHDGRLVAVRLGPLRLHLGVDVLEVELEVLLP